MSPICVAIFYLLVVHSVRDLRYLLALYCTYVRYATFSKESSYREAIMPEKKV